MVEAQAASQQAESAARDAAANTRSDDEAEEDAKLAKARSWDDWKVCIPGRTTAQHACGFVYDAYYVSLAPRSAG